MACRAGRRRGGAPEHASRSSNARYGGRGWHTRKHAHLVGLLKGGGVVAVEGGGRHERDVGAVVPQIEEALARRLLLPETLHQREKSAQAHRY